jgi:hypothetical protein
VEAESEEEAMRLLLPQFKRVFEQTGARVEVVRNPNTEHMSVER